MVILNWLHINGVDLSGIEFRTVHDVPHDSDTHFVSHNAEELRQRLERDARAPPLSPTSLPEAEADAAAIGDDDHDHAATAAAAHSVPAWGVL